MTQPQPRYKPGDRIGGRYQVHQVKMGGMGEVYLCLDLQEMHPYALKTFQQRYQSAALRKAFEHEVATWVALEKHPNIVRCFHMDIFDNRPFMVLEWIAGEEGKGADLRDWLRRGPLELQTALDIIIDVVRGLLHAQEKQPGIVHRDLKPENILVAQGPLAKITDFGLAQIVEQTGLELAGDEPAGRQSLMSKGGIAGTPPYMAPEQWRGEKLDERADIYAIGCILYELLAGEWPFRVDFTPMTPQQFKQWLRGMQGHHENDRPPTLPARYPEAVRELVTGCLAKKAVARPAGLAVLLELLTELYRQQFNRLPRNRPQAAAFTKAEYINRGRTYANLKQYELALADCNRAIKLDPDDTTAYNNRGGAYAGLQQYKLALADYNWVIELDPEHATAFYNRGTSYTDLQQYDLALADYNRAVELDPDYAMAFYNRGKIYEISQQYELALADYNRAVELDQDYVEAYTNRGNTYTKLQQYELALADYNRAIELDPNHVTAFYNRGSTYAKLQHYELALADFTRAIELDPNNAEAFYNRGSTYADLQHYELALADFTRAIDLNPADTTAYNNRGNTYAELQQYKLALADFTRAIELDPNNAEAFYNRAVTQDEFQQNESALLDFSRAIELDSDDAKFYIGRGNTYAKLQQYELAIADFTQAIELEPEYAPAFHNRGNIYSELQQYEQALADLERAIELAPEYAPAHFDLGVLLANIGQLHESLPYFEQAARFGLAQAPQAISEVRQRLKEQEQKSQKSSGFFGRLFKRG